LRLDGNLGVKIPPQMRQIFFLARGVDDEHQPSVNARRHQIVEDAAGFVQQQRVAHAPRREALQIARNQLFERLRRSLAAQRDLPHMRDIEQPGFGARVQMLGDDAGRVLHRHLVAGERDDAGAARAVQIVKRGAPQWRCCGGRGRFVGRLGHGRTSVADAAASGRCPLCPLP
jgi:hypothetical protein